MNYKIKNLKFFKLCFLKKCIILELLFFFYLIVKKEWISINRFRLKNQEPKKEVIYI